MTQSINLLFCAWKQKGKLSDLTSILTTHAVLRSDLYNDDSWIEFIELDIDKPNETEQDLETAFLIDHSASSSDSTHLINDFRDDDSGRASCCEQDLPDPDTVEFRNLMLSSASVLDPTATPQTGAAFQDSWSGTPDLYAQVRQVTLSGEVVLTPEEQSHRREVMNKRYKPKCDQTTKEPEFHVRVLGDSDERGNTSEPDNNNMSTNQSTDRSTSTSLPLDDVNGAPRQPLMGYQEPQVAPATAPELTGPPSSALASPPEYTVVDGTDPQNSLLLRSNTPMAPSSSHMKQMPSLEGYLSPDLLDSIAFWMTMEQLWLQIMESSAQNLDTIQ